MEAVIVKYHFILSDKSKQAQIYFSWTTFVQINLM